LTHLLAGPIPLVVLIEAFSSPLRTVNSDRMPRYRLFFPFLPPVFEAASFRDGRRQHSYCVCTTLVFFLLERDRQASPFPLAGRFVSVPRRPLFSEEGGFYFSPQAEAAFPFFLREISPFWKSFSFSNVLGFLPWRKLPPFPNFSGWPPPFGRGSAGRTPPVDFSWSPKLSPASFLDALFCLPPAGGNYLSPSLSEEEHGPRILPKFFILISRFVSLFLPEADLYPSPSTVVVVLFTPPYYAPAFSFPPPQEGIDFPPSSRSPKVLWV